MPQQERAGRHHPNPQRLESGRQKRVGGLAGRVFGTCAIMEGTRLKVCRTSETPRVRAIP